METLNQIQTIIEEMLEENNHKIKILEYLTNNLDERSSQLVESSLGALTATNCELLELLDLFKENEVSILEHKQPSITYGHHHDLKQKRKQINRLSRVIGHLGYVKRMMENDEDCSHVLMQMSAAKSAMNGLSKEIINEHLAHCITHAIEDGNKEMVEEFQKVIQKYI